MYYFNTHVIEISVHMDAYKNFHKNFNSYKIETNLNLKKLNM